MCNVFLNTRVFAGNMGYVACVKWNLVPTLISSYAIGSTSIYIEKLRQL